MSKNEDRIDLLNKIYDLLLDDGIKVQERNLFLEIKVSIEAGNDFNEIRKNLIHMLNLFAVRGELSEKALELFNELSKAENGGWIGVIRY